jgi:hypothetical protein
MLLFTHISLVCDICICRELLWQITRRNPRLRVMQGHETSHQQQKIRSTDEENGILPLETMIPFRLQCSRESSLTTPNSTF